jgi:hypothetical protein
MMQVEVHTLRSEFRLTTEEAHRRLTREHQLRTKEKQERQKELEAEAEEFLDLALALVSSNEIEELLEDVSRYEVATVAALQKNTNDLELVQERLDALLEQAFLLPDGRRVFKTEDGMRVFDQHGTELDRSVIDPDIIPDDLPRWETYKAGLDEKAHLLEERRSLHEYQAKLDQARERLDAGEITREEFEKLSSDLRELMPQAVRQQLATTEPTAKLETATTSDPVLDLDLASDMVPTSMQPRL